jgi:hypothetical protein
MPATLIWGRGFVTTNATASTGQVYQEVSGIDGGMEMISWSSVAEIESLAETHGVSRSSWPVYRDCELESQVPLEDAQRRSDLLRAAFQSLEPRILQENHWLGFIAGLLRDGNSFFVMV